MALLIIDYRPILQAAKVAGVEHFYVEQEPPFIGMTDLEAATKDYAYIRALSAQLTHTWTMQTDPVCKAGL